MGSAPGLAVNELLVCNGSACSHEVADRVAEAVSRSLAERCLDRRVQVVRVGCRGEDVGKVTITASPPGWRVRGVDEGRASAVVAAIHRDPTAAPAGAEWPQQGGEGPKGILRRCGFVDPCSLEEYVASGGFRALERVLTHPGGRAWARRTLESSGLLTRDGEGEPLAKRLAAGQRAGAAVVLCPCLSSDAHLFADSLLLGGDPFSVIEGVLLAGFVIGASRALLMPPAGAHFLVGQLELAVALARRRGLVGGNILGTGQSFQVRVIPAPRQLVAAEEAALRRLILTGGALKPPPRWLAETLPPAVVVDPESAARLCGVLELAVAGGGAGEGLAAQRLLTVTGHAVAPAVLEVPVAATLDEVLTHLPRRGDAQPKGKGVLAGGLMGVFGVPPEVGVSLGSLLVLNQGTCVVRFVADILAVLAGEECGACGPGRVGVHRLRDLWAQGAAGESDGDTLSAIRDIAAHVGATARCGLGRSAARFVASALQVFPEEIAAHFRSGGCRALQCGGRAWDR